MQPKVSDSVNSFKLYKEYSRENVHEVFHDGTKYVTGGGIWGRSGVVKPKLDEDVFVLFCVIKPKQSSIPVQYIEPDGKFHWLSQPSMYPGEKKLKSLIAGSTGNSSVLLFAKNRPGPTYAFLGKLTFLEVDENSIKPTVVTWKINPWPMPISLLERFGIK